MKAKRFLQIQRNVMFFINMKIMSIQLSKKNRKKSYPNSISGWKIILPISIEKNQKDKIKEKLAIIILRRYGHKSSSNLACTAHQVLSWYRSFFPFLAETRGPRSAPLKTTFSIRPDLSSLIFVFPNRFKSFYFHLMAGISRRRTKIKYLDEKLNGGMKINFHIYKWFMKQ